MELNIGGKIAKIDLKGKKLFFGKREIVADVRSFEKLKEVAMDPKSVPEGIAYYMFRGVEEVYDLRYDVTVIPFAMMGDEFVKTYGHYHPKTNHLSYPEVYQVVKGKAIFLLQDEGLDHFLAVLAEEGDVVFIPPNHGHVTVNVGKDILVLANAVYAGFQSDYSRVREKGGFAWYLTKNGFVENRRYERHPKPEILKTAVPPFDLLSLLLERPKVFDFLRKPYKIMWDKVVLFEEGTWSPETL